MDTMNKEELQGFFEAFAWINHKTNAGYTFKLTEYAFKNDETLDAALQFFYGPFNDSAQFNHGKWSSVKLADWSAELKILLQKWLFQYIAGNPSLIDEKKDFSLSSETFRNDMIKSLIVSIESFDQISAGFKIELESTGFYEIQWDDIVLISSTKAYLFHFGWSD